MQQNLTNTSPKHIIKTLTIIHAAFIAGPFIFSLVILFISSEISIFNTDNIPAAYYIIPFVALIIIYAGLRFFRNQLSKIDKQSPLNQKLVNYQTAFIIKCASIEAPAFLCIMLTILSGETVFLIITWSILLFLYTIRPKKEKVIADLSLSFDERKLLNA
ncbi:hypothetical protein BTO05_04430 [Winogradskyella sp. PC-19]|uniref:hypothetical protein n=1 Tax=unclassified Winogradskyella TaxID=2615021 RepID=UPI000B3C7DF5|nr:MULTISPECIES: hypothetical protein [unclassified Winogradskyella]ARV08916.1 hypothetical protein BTO05_04430 [Winogradskyella sp. PC-19]RZN78463.1 MAG: hypothetical protein EVB12_05370 [Winogradskyella sp.]